MRLVAYLRTSTANGDSLAAQEDACRRWAEHNGYEVVQVQRDSGVSGGKPVDERPGLAAALIAIESGDAEGIVVHNVDRLARELHVQEAALDRAWRAEGSVFETFDGEIPRDDPADPQRTFLRQVLGAAAQLERGLIRARLARGRTRKGERGGYIGGRTVPFGYRVEGGHLVEDPEKRRAVRLIVHERRAERTWRDVAAAVREAGWDLHPNTCKAVYYRETGEPRRRVARSAEGD